MSNHERFDLTDEKPLEVEAQYLVEVLECLFHHILFHRSLGAVLYRYYTEHSFQSKLSDWRSGGKVVPRDAAILNNIFYVKCDDARLEQKVRESSEAAATALRKQENVGRISLVFYATEKGFVTNKKVPWEEWVMRIVVKTEPTFGRHHDLLRKKELESRVNSLMWLIHQYVNVRRDHLPAVPPEDPHQRDDVLKICYPFEIKFPSSKDGVQNFIDLLFSGTTSKVQVPL